MWSDTTAMDNLRADNGSTVTKTICANNADTSMSGCYTSHDISTEHNSRKHTARHTVYKVVATGPEMDICCNAEVLLAGRENLDKPTSAAISATFPESVDSQGQEDSPVIVSRATRSDAASARRSSCPTIRYPMVANAHSELNSPDIAYARRSSCPILHTGSLQADAARLHRHLQVRAPVAEDVLVEFFGIQTSCPSAASAIPAKTAAVPGVQTTHTFLCQDNQCLPTILARRLGRTFDDTDIDGFQIHLDSLLDSANANQRLSEVLQRLSPDSNSLIRDGCCSTSEL
jgi:hypothetical protein